MAGLIPQDFIADLIERVPLSEVIGSRITLKKSGSSLTACCPFHQEKTPSFHVNAQKNFYHCFGCGELHITGLHFTAIAGENLDLTGKFTVTENHQGAPGLAHGGLLSLAFDEALGKLMWLIRTPAVTGRAWVRSTVTI